MCEYNIASLSSYGMPPFNGKTDFGMWQQKMECILVKHICYQAIDLSYYERETEKKKNQLNILALSNIILNLSEVVLRKVGNMTSAKELWEKFQELYTEMSLSSRLYLLKTFFPIQT